MCDQQSLRSACALVQSDQSLCSTLEYSMIVKLQTEHNLEFLSLKGGCRGWSESTLVKMLTCWKSHATAHWIIKETLLLEDAWPSHQIKLLLIKKIMLTHGSHRLEKYLNLECFLEKYLKIKYALKSTRKSCKGLKKSLNSSIFCRN